jgi:CheY-like chemotaxis protein
MIPKPTLLLVEDNAGDIRLIEEALRECGSPCRLQMARNGEEALAWLLNRAPHDPLPSLIVLDLNLPRMDGRELLAELKQHPVLRQIPVVVLTTSDSELDIVHCYNLHANCYITKPLGYADFVEVVTRIDQFWFRIVKLPPSLTAPPRLG